MPTHTHTLLDRQSQSEQDLVQVRGRTEQRGEGGQGRQLDQSHQFPPQHRADEEDDDAEEVPSR